MAVTDHRHNKASGLQIVGAQWGDEGKGKLSHALSYHADYCVRYHGGANAGHSIKPRDGTSMVLHLVPCGIMHEDVHCLIGRGTVLDIDRLTDEVQKLDAMRPDLRVRSRLAVSYACPVVLPWHVAVDEAVDDSTASLGTTRRGIGPVMEDRAARRAVRVGDCFKPDDLKARLQQISNRYNVILKHQYNENTISMMSVYDAVMTAFDSNVKDLVTDDEAYMRDRVIGATAVYEGAQGAMLDLDFGTWPYVTSTNTMPFDLARGVGYDGSHVVGHTLLVAKAYVTRVGVGPLPTTMDDDVGSMIAEKGKEWGASTGRARRIGWLDIPLLRHVVDKTARASLALTKADVLSDLKTVKVCVGYDGVEAGKSPSLMSLQPETHGLRPIYREFEGWGDLTQATSYADLDSRFRVFVDFLEDELQIPVSLISNGPEERALLETPHVAQLVRSYMTSSRSRE